MSRAWRRSLRASFAAVATPEQRAEIRQRARLLEPGVGAVEHRDCLPERQLALPGAGGKACGPQRHPGGARSAERAGRVHLRLAEASRGLGLAERQVWGRTCLTVWCPASRWYLPHSFLRIRR
jgi:hypothetical protein